MRVLLSLTVDCMRMLDLMQHSGRFARLILYEVPGFMSTSYRSLRWRVCLGTVAVAA